VRTGLSVPVAREKTRAASCVIASRESGEAIQGRDAEDWIASALRASQ
jgi:hypothetical protein